MKSKTVVLRLKLLIGILCIGIAISFDERSLPPLVLKYKKNFA